MNNRSYCVFVLSFVVFWKPKNDWCSFLSCCSTSGGIKNVPFGFIQIYISFFFLKIENFHIFSIFFQPRSKPFLTIFLAHIFLNSFLSPAIFDPLSLFDFGTGMFPSIHWHLAHVGNFKTDFASKKIQRRFGILEFSCKF